MAGYLMLVCGTLFVDGARHSGVHPFTPKFSSLFSTIPGPVMAGYLMLVCGTLFVDGARTIILNEPNREKVVAGGICFWIGAAFQFGLITLPDVE